jgi:hypothetical protein
MPSYTRLKGIVDINEVTFSDMVEDNLIDFFNWGMLCIGGFGSVQVGSSGEASRLAPVKHPDYLDGQVWQGFRQDWVWETGIEYSIQPIPVTGVWVNGTFYSGNTTGVYKHHVNYPLGQIVFDTPIAYTGGTTVETSYSYRLYTFQSSDSEWFRAVMFQSFRVDDSQFLQFGSGVWNVLAQDRVQLPAVVVEVVPRRQVSGFELGGTSTVQQDILFHIFSETPWHRKKMIDVITFQKDKTIPLYDENKVAAADRYPLDYGGSIASGALTFPDMVKPTGQGGFYWRGGTFLQVGSQETISTPPLYQAVVRTTFEVNLLIV